MEEIYTDAQKNELKESEVALRGGKKDAISKWIEMLLIMALFMAKKFRPKGESYPVHADDLAQDSILRAMEIGLELLDGTRPEIVQPECFMWKVMEHRMLDLLNPPGSDLFVPLDDTMDFPDERSSEAQDEFEAELLREDISTVSKDDKERELIDRMVKQPDIDAEADLSGCDDRTVKRRLKSIGKRYAAKLVKEDRAAPFGKKGRYPTAVKPRAVEVPEVAGESVPDMITVASRKTKPATSELELFLAT